MKYLFAILITIVAFIGGRYSALDSSHHLPSLPIAFVQATQPVALTINVDLEAKDAADTAKHNVHQLRGTASYKFTNLTDKAVSMAFPPTRTFSISSTSLGRDSEPCPDGLNTKQVIDIPANSSISLSGDWSSTVIGDLQSYLVAGAGHHGFRFSSDADHASFGGTLIAFQSFRGVSAKSRFHTIDGHLELVTPTPKP